MLEKRFELKIPISAGEKESFLEACEGHLVADTNGVNAAYRVSSMYFDNEDLLSYREKIDGERIRRKFRLRYYSDTGSRSGEIVAAFMEIKHRINNSVFKERVQLTNEGALEIMSDPSKLKVLNRYACATENNHDLLVAEIEHSAASMNLRAINVISYLRQAWEGISDNRLRVTFDSSCEVLKPHSFLSVHSGIGKQIMPISQLLLEVKFDSAIPRWIRDHICKFNFSVQRFSKYGSGVEFLGLI